ncbi:unnamed protein product, partial [Bubo scandiacus]
FFVLIGIDPFSPTTSLACSHTFFSSLCLHVLLCVPDCLLPSPLLHLSLSLFPSHRCTPPLVLYLPVPVLPPVHLALSLTL